MKIVSLNTWAGKAGKEKLLAFFESHREVDVFCLQEIWSGPIKELEGIPKFSRKTQVKDGVRPARNISSPQRSPGIFAAASLYLWAPHVCKKEH
jgi:hypothetical protein